PVTTALTAPPPALASTCSDSSSACTLAILACISWTCFSIFIGFCISAPRLADLGHRALQLAHGVEHHRVLLRGQTAAGGSVGGCGVQSVLDGRGLAQPILHLGLDGVWV